MATAGEAIIKAKHLNLLNRLRRMGSGKMKLASEMTPEKKAVIVKRIMLKAKPIQEGVVPKDAETSAPPTSSHASGAVRELGKIFPPKIDEKPKLAEALAKGAMLPWLAKAFSSKPKVPVAAAVAKPARPTTPPGARAAAFGTKPIPGVHTGNDFSRAMGRGPSTGDWEHLGADEARLMLKNALMGIL